MTIQASFLAASDGTPLVKTYTSQTQKQSYPHVLNFDSYTHDIESLKDFKDYIEHYAKNGACLLKGKLLKDLANEPRAGSTDPGIHTQWICLDIDGLPGVATVEQLIEQIPCFRGVSYISQASASMGIEPDKGLSAHAFFMLETAVQPSVLKQWLIHLNLKIELLKNNLKLARSGVVLKWPLDITTCQNDKLLYIAPPHCAEGVVDHFDGPRIKLVEKDRERVKLNLAEVNIEWNDAEKQKQLNKLRKAAGLPPRKKFTEKNICGLPVITNPGKAQVTGVKAERGFVYLNLNGGDSWGYFHPENNPEVLQNFKGEPNYLIKEFLPDYYEQYVKQNAPKTEKKGEGVAYLAILDTRTELYYRGSYNYETDELDLRPTGKSETRKLRDFLKQHGQEVPEYFEEWRTEYDFESNEIFDPQNRWINLYHRSKYMRNPNRACEEIPPITKKIISHVFAYDEKCIAHFLNWLAVIVQQRKMTGTAWIMHGVQGTGKGLLFNYIIKPLLGDEYTSRCHLSSFQEPFNTFLESSLLLFVDEVQISELQKRSIAMSRIKQYIVEPEVSIRRMYCNPYITRNRCNFIFASNKHDSIEVDPDDRRFNVPPRQTKPIMGVITPAEIKAIHTELHDFAGFLFNFEADRHAAGTPINTQERIRLQELTRDTGEMIVDAFNSGNIRFFIDNMPDSQTDLVRLETETGLSNAPTYNDIINEWMSTKGSECIISRRQLQVIFYYLAEIKHKSPNKFSRYLGHKGLDLQQVWHDGRNQQGIKVNWKITDIIEQEWKLYSRKTRVTKDIPHEMLC